MTMEFPAHTRFQTLKDTASYSRKKTVPIRDGLFVMTDVTRKTGLQELTPGGIPCIVEAPTLHIDVASLRRFLDRNGIPEGFKTREELPSNKEERVDLALAIILARLGPWNNRVINPAGYDHLKWRCHLPSFPDTRADILTPAYVDRFVGYLKSHNFARENQIGAFTAYTARSADKPISGEPYDVEEQLRFAGLVEQQLFPERNLIFYPDFLFAFKNTSAYGSNRESWDLREAIERCYGLNIIPHQTIVPLLDKREE